MNDINHTDKDMQHWMPRGNEWVEKIAWMKDNHDPSYEFFSRLYESLVGESYFSKPEIRSLLRDAELFRQENPGKSFKVEYRTIVTDIDATPHDSSIERVASYHEYVFSINSLEEGRPGMPRSHAPRASHVPEEAK